MRLCAGMVVLIAALGAATPAHQSAAERFDPAALHAAAGNLSRLYSVVISWRGERLFERYYNGARPDRPTNVKSASKSIISTLVGIAIDRRLLPGTDATIAAYLPEAARAADPRKRQITIGHLLEMRSGLESTSGRNYGAWVLSRNWVQHALARPMFAAPGAVMEYSTGNTHLLSAILTKATGMSTWQFANTALARPLGFSLPQWPRDPQGIYFGGNDMLMTPRQLLAVGELYLRNGRAAGTQIVSESWVRRSCAGRRREFGPGERRGDRQGGAQRVFDPLRDRQDGYGWWVYEIEGFDTCFAWGYGGQYVFVIPALDLVFVTTASPDVSEERRDHRRQVFDILTRLVVRPLAASSPPGSPGPDAAPHDRP